MSAQVPQGATPGQTLQIQTASGLLDVVVPPGVSEGQSFQVQVPVVSTSVAAVEVSSNSEVKRNRSPQRKASRKMEVESSDSCSLPIDTSEISPGVNPRSAGDMQQFGRADLPLHSFQRAGK